jgi:hypothetical protein
MTALPKFISKIQWTHLHKNQFPAAHNGKKQP